MPLSLAHALSVLSDDRVVFQRQTFDELLDVGDPGCQQQTGLVDLPVSHGYVAGNRFREQVSLLHDRSALAAPPVEVKTGKVIATDTDPAIGRFIETQQQLDQCRLSAATRSHNGRHLPLRNMQGHIVQHLGRTRTLVLESQMADTNVTPAIRIGTYLPFRSGFLLPVPDLAHPFQRDLYILPAIDKLHELFDRGIQLSDDILDRKHHSERQVSVNHGSCRHDGDHDVLHFVDKNTARLLSLLQFHRLDTRAEQICLDIFPFPASSPFAALQFDLLHPVQQLHRLALVAGPLFEIGIVQQPSPFQEQENPDPITHTTQQENGAYQQIVI